MVQIHPFHIEMPFNLGKVNCYLLQSQSNYLLIDTGSSNQRAVLENNLREVGCNPGDLKMILLTHGDFDHTGNAAYIRKVFGAPVAMHQADLDMAEKGNMFFNRKQPNILVQKLVPVFFGFGRDKQFSPDIIVGDGYDLAELGFDAKILHIPGHSSGSLGVLTEAGALFCGDLLENTKVPALNSLMDDPEAGQKSLQKLNAQGVKMVYPGHGMPFEWTPLLG